MTEPDGRSSAECDAQRSLNGALKAVYSCADDAVSASGSECLISGRCCRFREYDHVLYLSRIEADLLFAEAAPRQAHSTTTRNAPGKTPKDFARPARRGLWLAESSSATLNILKPGMELWRHI